MKWIAIIAVCLAVVLYGLNALNRAEVGLEQREDGLYYKSGAETAFTGDGLVYHPNGQKEQQGKIEAGKVIAEPFWSPDLMVACAKLAGAKLPPGVVLDGKDPLPVLTQNAKSPHASFYFQFRNHAALRQGHWKIVREKPTLPWQLFNLKDDLSESKNLAEEQPGQVEKLKATCADWEKSF